MSTDELERLLATVRTLEVTGDITIAGARALRIILKENEERREMRCKSPSYHDLYITTPNIPRTRLVDLPYGYQVTCSRVGGWQLCRLDRPESEQITGEFNKVGLRLDVDKHIICDSLKEDSDERV